MKTVGIYIGRFSPLHLGHQKIINTMIKDRGIENCLVIVGSVQEKSERVPYNYLTRKIMLRKVYGGELKIAGSADQPGNNTGWFALILETIFLHFQDTDEDLQLVFYGGHEKDLTIIRGWGHKVKIVDREDLPISGTYIRQTMKLMRTLDGLVDERIIEMAYDERRTI